MPAAEVDIDADLVRSLLADQHPDLADLPLRQANFGWDNVVFRLGDDLAVRVPRRQFAAELVEHEQRWLPELAPRLPLPVPTPIRVGRPALGYPWRWSVVAWMDGADAATDPPVDAHETAVVLGGFLRALHVPAPDDAPVHRFRGVPLADRHEITVQAIDSLAGMIDGDRVRAEWDAALALPVHDGPKVWLHGDLHPANLVVRDGRLAGVVDFGDLTSGDPATDLLVAWSLLPASAHRAFRDAVGDVDDDTWRRGRAWALAHAVACLASSADNPTIAAFSRRGLAAVLADAAADA
jgi:aminoglycoside phosphotransferase (APT) family kinase protein